VILIVLYDKFFRESGILNSFALPSNYSYRHGNPHHASLARHAQFSENIAEQLPVLAMLQLALNLTP
jgi:hypothetical protein